MNPVFNFRSLTREDLGQMYRTFLEAFSDYSVNMKMSREAFEDRMVSKLNIRFDLSPGVFSGDKLIAFILHTVNKYEDSLAAYNGGTGVIPGYRGHGLTAKMYEFVDPQLRKEGVKKCVLEVLEDNHVAILSYEGVGFQKSKKFQCLMLKGGRLKRTLDMPDALLEVGDFVIDEYAELGGVVPGMLDQLTQVKYHLQKEIILEYRKEGQLIAYIIFQPVNGRITQLAVRPDFRRQGIGSAMLIKMHTLSENKTLSVLNIEDREKGLISFFESNGFTCDLQQWEMQKTLDYG
ncbi:MAG: GNAT family N-acetyltransferase [Reichenbachiella sp.]|uniref:GNAT family N-acetyltransferase n=1 Tax=Reichenbachiella sp. TaxID=2184521 RepID=UPI0032645F22